MSFLSGLMLGLSLIVAIGAQNIWVLSQSMAGANRLVVALVCIVCDASLIVIGIYAASEIQQWLPNLLPGFTWLGIAILLYLAATSLVRAIRGTGGLKVESGSHISWWKTMLTGFAICLLNPHVYLDTVMLLGNIGALQPEPYLFAFGACVASVVWFTGLVLFSPKLKELLSSPFRWRIFDTSIAAILCVVALQLYTFV